MVERGTCSEMLTNEYQTILCHNPEDDGFVVKLFYAAGSVF
jgi:hypothetical protein